MRYYLLAFLMLVIIGCGHSIVGPVTPNEPSSNIDSVQYTVSADVNDYLSANRILIATDIVSDTITRVIHNTSIPNISKALELGYDSTKGDTVIVDSSVTWVTLTYIYKNGFLIEWYNTYHQYPYIGASLEKHEYTYFGGRLIQEKIYSFGSWMHTIKVTYFKSVK